MYVCMHICRYSYIYLYNTHTYIYIYIYIIIIIIIIIYMYILYIDVFGLGQYFSLSRCPISKCIRTGAFTYICISKAKQATTQQIKLYINK